MQSEAEVDYAIRELLEAKACAPIEEAAAIRDMNLMLKVLAWVKGIDSAIDPGSFAAMVAGFRTVDIVESVD